MARQEGRFYENLACIALSIGSELHGYEKSLITREITYIVLFFCKKEKCPRLQAWPKATSPKMSKNVKKGQSLDLEPRLRLNIAR